MSPRLTALDPAQATGPAAALFTAVKAKLGVVPNLMRTLGHSPAALEAYLGLRSTLAKGVLPAQVGEQLALAVSQANACDYCLAAHSRLGRGAGLSPEAIAAARLGRASEPKTAALLAFANAVVHRQGHVTDEELAAVRAAGATEAEIVEVVAHVAAMIYTNYLNHVAETEIDFPRAAPLPGQN